MSLVALDPVAAPVDRREGDAHTARASSQAADVVLEAQGISKCYRLFKRPQDRLKQTFCFGRRRYFEEFWALRDVSIQLRRGETIGIIGRNGSGKSTLLQILCGILRPTTGGVRVQGRVAALLELGAGFNPEFTGRENVFLNAAIMGVSHGDIASRLDDILAFADIGEHIDQPVKTYSSGMFVRLAFAVIAHVDADILVIDEALAVGDAYFTQKCMRFLRRFRERGTILFVSHDAGTVSHLCSSVVWLDKGVVRDIGPAKQVTEGYLDALFADQQGLHRLTRPERPSPADEPERQQVDRRLKYINTSPLRNDLQIVRFDPERAAFGKGGASIMHVELQDEQGRPLSWSVGGEIVQLRVFCQTHQTIDRPILGFLVKDGQGQVLFSDNTCLTYSLDPVSVQAGDVLEGRFMFRMPVLPVGDYSVAVSAAEGTQEEHVQHHWIHDALMIKSVSSSVCTGLVGIPMKAIQMRRVAAHV